MYKPVSSFGLPYVKGDGSIFLKPTIGEPTTSLITQCLESAENLGLVAMMNGRYSKILSNWYQYCIVCCTSVGCFMFKKHARISDIQNLLSELTIHGYYIGVLKRENNKWYIDTRENWLYINGRMYYLHQLA